MDNHSIYLGLIELGIEPATATQAANVSYTFNLDWLTTKPRLQAC